MHPFTPSTRKPKFAVSLEIIDLNNIPLVSGTCYVKWHLPHSISAEHRGRTESSPIKDHLVTWNYKKSLTVRMTIDRQSLLESCEIRFEIVQEYFSGAKGEKIELGWVKLNLAEYVAELENASSQLPGSPVQNSAPKLEIPKAVNGASGAAGSGPPSGAASQPSNMITRRYLMRESKINSTLKLSVGLQQLSGDRNYIAPPLRTAPVFGGIAGFMAGADQSTASLHGSNPDDETNPNDGGSRTREGGKSGFSIPLKDRIENQDLYRSCLVARWAALPDELPPEQMIEDIFNGGSGWPRHSANDSTSDESSGTYLNPQALSANPSSHSREGSGGRRLGERQGLFRRQHGPPQAGVDGAAGGRPAHHRPWQKRTSTSPSASRSFWGGLHHRHHSSQSHLHPSHSFDSLGSDQSGRRTTTGRGSGVDRSPKIGGAITGKVSHKRGTSGQRHDSLAGSSDMTAPPSINVRQSDDPMSGDPKWVDEFDVREDLRSWTIAGYG